MHTPCKSTPPLPAYLVHYELSEISFLQAGPSALNGQECGVRKEYDHSKVDLLA